jgi:hypothetical protein
MFGGAPFPARRVPRPFPLTMFQARAEEDEEARKTLD